MPYLRNGTCSGSLRRLATKSTPPWLSGLLGMPWHTTALQAGVFPARFRLPQAPPSLLLGGVNRHHQCVGDTLMMRSLGEAPIVVNAGFSLGDT
ncbi:MAG: hypothetical protein ACI31F_08645 [Muribaculaceae bacterium]